MSINSFEVLLFFNIELI